MIDTETRLKIADLLSRYGELIDADRLEDWLDLFTDEATYRIVPRENEEQDLPLPYMYCDSKKMLVDRVNSLRRANVYNFHYDRHLISGLTVEHADDGAYLVGANYAVFQTTHEGETSIFSVGRYEDLIVEEDGDLLFKDKLVVPDTGSVPRLLSTPL